MKLSGWLRVIKSSHLGGNISFEQKNFYSEIMQRTSRKLIIDAASGGIQSLLDVLDKIRFTYCDHMWDVLLQSLKIGYELDHSVLIFDRGRDFTFPSIFRLTDWFIMLSNGYLGPFPRGEAAKV